jgi:putative sugar O-methyltransferase
MKKKIKSYLKTIFKDFQNKCKIYKPTFFWKDATENFFKIFYKVGIKNFKRNSLANSFFIPLYNFGKEKNILQIQDLIKKKKISKKFLFYFSNLVSGKFQALSDYRVFKAADNQSKYPFLHTFTEKKLGNPVEQFEFDNKKFSKSSLNYLLGLAFFKKNIKKFIPRVTLEIGGGYGVLGEILSFSKIKNFKYINVDLPNQTLVTEMYLSQLFGETKVSSYLQTRRRKEIYIKNLKNFTSLVSWQIEKLKGKIDLFVNFISFQEMEPHVVKNYLNIIIKLKPEYILLRNLREGKQLKKAQSVGVEKMIKFEDYVFFLKKNYYLLNKNVIPFGYRTFDNFNSELLIFRKI